MTHDGDSGEPPPGGSPTPNARSHRLGTPPRPAPTDAKEADAPFDLITPEYQWAPFGFAPFATALRALRFSG